MSYLLLPVPLILLHKCSVMLSQSAECSWGTSRVTSRCTEWSIALVPWGCWVVMVAWYKQVMELFTVDNKYTTIGGILLAPVPTCQEVVGGGVLYRCCRFSLWTPRCTFHRLEALYQQPVSPCLGAGGGGWG